MSPRPDDPDREENEIIDSDELSETEASWTAPPPAKDSPPLRPPPPPFESRPARQVQTEAAWTGEPPGPTDAEKKRMRIMAAGAGVFGLLFIILFVYACRASSARDDARSQVAKLGDDNKQLSDALELHRSGKQQVESQLTVCNQEKTEGTTRVTRVEAELTVCREQATDLQEQADRKVKELNAFTERFRDMIDAGKLKVEIRRGQMVVDLPAEVLFPSGRAQLTKPGRAAIDKVAAILRKMPGRRFTVAGHTDTWKTTGTDYKSNWELSAARAVNVTEALIAEGMNPRNLIAAGFGEYTPVASNNNPRGRQLNRRIEIILEPDLSTIPKAVMPKPAPAKKPAPKGKGK